MVCGYTDSGTIPVEGHTFGTGWESDGTNHWNECSCGEKANVAAHAPGSWITDLAATETTDGSKHKECTICGYITETEVIPATGESHSHTYGTEWKSDGTNHWNECSCGDKTNIAAHTPGDWVVKTPATETTNGVKEKICSVCGYITDTDVIPATGSSVVYDITKGANSSWKKGTLTGVTITCDGDIAKFTGIKIGGVLIGADKYTKDSGSTVVTFKPEYLETLALGAHTVEFIYDDGIAQTGLTILAADGTTDPETPPEPKTPGNTVEPDGDKYIEKDPDGKPIGEWTWDEDKGEWVFDQYPPAQDSDPSIPVTGDDTDMILWLLLGGASLTVLGGLTVTRKRRKYRVVNK